MVVYSHFLRALPHERVDHGKLLSNVGKELGNGVPGQRYAGMEFGEEGILIFLLQLAVLHVGVAYPEHRHRIELHGIVVGIHLLDLGESSSHSCASAQSRSVGANEEASFFAMGTYFPSMMWPTVGPFTGTFLPLT